MGLNDGKWNRFYYDNHVEWVNQFTWVILGEKYEGNFILNTFKNTDFKWVKQISPKIFNSLEDYKYFTLLTEQF